MELVRLALQVSLQGGSETLTSECLPRCLHDHTSLHTLLWWRLWWCKYWCRWFYPPTATGQSYSDGGDGLVSGGKCCCWWCNWWIFQIIFYNFITILFINLDFVYKRQEIHLMTRKKHKETNNFINNKVVVVWSLPNFKCYFLHFIFGTYALIMQRVSYDEQKDCEYRSRKKLLQDSTVVLTLNTCKWELDME